MELPEVLGVESNGLVHRGKVTLAPNQQVSLLTGRVGWWALGGDDNPCIGKGTKFMSEITIESNWQDAITTTLGTANKINIISGTTNDSLTIIENTKSGNVTIWYSFLMSK